MKSLTHIIAVLIVVNWALAGYVLAQDSRPAQLLQAEEALAQKQVELAVKAGEAAVAQRAAQVMATDAKLSDDYAARVQADMALQQAYSLAFDQAERGSAEQVLLVLTLQIKAEDLANVTADLNIMSRILDNKLGRSRRSPVTSRLIELGYSVGRSGHAGAVQTQAMYVQSYAAILFIDVDFPLSPPPQVQAEKVKEGADPVWEQTKRQITAPEQDFAIGSLYQLEAAAKQYDAEKVEQLKTSLTKALKHAANIRNLKADESVILVVAGTEVPTMSGSILTIRAKKADIDAYAAAKTDYDQFRQRTQILTSRASLGPRQAETRSWPSQNLQR